MKLPDGTRYSRAKIDSVTMTPMHTIGSTYSMLHACQPVPRSQTTAKALTRKTSHTSAFGMLRPL